MGLERLKLSGAASGGQHPHWGESWEMEDKTEKDPVTSSAPSVTMVMNHCAAESEAAMI